MNYSEKTPYFSQKTSSSIKKHNDYIESFQQGNFFDGIFGCYLPKKSKQKDEEKSSIMAKKNHQGIENLNGSHYSERIYQSNQHSLIHSEISQKKPSFENLSFTEKNRSNIRSPVKSEVKKKIERAIWNENLPDICILDYLGKVIIGKICLHSIYLKKLKNRFTPSTIEKQTKISVKSSCEALFKFQKEELINNSGNFTYISHGEVSNLNNSSMVNPKIDSKLYLMHTEPRNSKYLQRISSHISKKMMKCGNLVYDIYTRSGFPSLEVT